MNSPERRSPSPSQQFRQTVEAMSLRVLTSMVGEERAREAAGRVNAAFNASVMSARDPDDFYNSTPASVAQCIAIAALTGIMPSTGQGALAYVIPRRPRKGEKPQLNYQLSHRGVGALVRRGGSILLPIPVGHNDTIEVEYGEVTRHECDIDDPPVSWDDLRGCIAVIKDAASGAVLFRGWVPKKIIAQHREQSDTFQWAERNPDWAKRKSPWHANPVPMAMKTTMHYAIGRGWAIVDDTEAVRALSTDAAGDVLDIEPGQYEVTGSAPATAHDALGLSQRPALDVDATPAQDLAAEAARLNDRELVEVDLSALPNVLEEFKARIGDPYDLVEDCGGVRTKDLAQQDESVQRLVLARMNDELSSLDD